MRLLPLSAALLAACSGEGPVLLASPPSVELFTETGPHIQGEDLTIEAQVSDRATAPEDLRLRWEANGNRVCSDSSAGEDGLAACTLTLDVDTALTLTVTDADDESATASLDLTVAANQAPTIGIVRPAADATLFAGVAIPVEAQLADADHDADTLTVAWTDNGDVLTATGGVTDSSGLYTAVIQLEPGPHILHARVSDPLGASQTATVEVDVVSDDTPPTCAFVQPAEGASIATVSPIALVATAADNLTESADIDVVLTSSIDGAIPTTIDATGTVQASFTATSGAHTLILTATDAAGLTCTATRSIEVCTATWYADMDEDGFGDPEAVQVACEQPVDFVADNTDCDDTTDQRYPGADEICDLLDNDCDTLVDDEDADADAFGSTWYADGDSDSFGDATTAEVFCTAPSDYVQNGTDCDDAANTTFPGAAEVCDRVDNDCDTRVDDDDDDLSATTYYADADSDGFGDPNTPEMWCTPPSSAVTDNTDCDDTEADRYPGALEICDGLQNDCDDPMWTDDDGIASFKPDDGPWQDWTSAMLGDEVVVDTDGVLPLCPGVWSSAVRATEAALTVYSPLATDDVPVSQSTVLAASVTVIDGALTVSGIHMMADVDGAMLIASSSDLTVSDVVIAWSDAFPPRAVFGRSSRVWLEDVEMVIPDASAVQDGGSFLSQTRVSLADDILDNTLDVRNLSVQIGEATGSEPFSSAGRDLFVSGAGHVDIQGFSWGGRRGNLSLQRVARVTIDDLAVEGDGLRISHLTREDEPEALAVSSVVATLDGGQLLISQSATNDVPHTMTVSDVDVVGTGAGSLAYIRKAGPGSLAVSNTSYLDVELQLISEEEVSHALVQQLDFSAPSAPRAKAELMLVGDATELDGVHFSDVVVSDNDGFRHRGLVNLGDLYYPTTSFTPRTGSQTFDVVDLTFDDVQVPYQRAALRIGGTEAGTTVTMQGVAIRDVVISPPNNMADPGPPAAFKVCDNAGAVVCDGCTFSDVESQNSATPVAIRDACWRIISVSGTNPVDYEAMDLRDAGTVTFTNATFSGGSAEQGPGHLLIDDASTVTITGSTFTDGTTDEDGGHIAITAPANVTVADSTFTNGTAQGDGGHIHVSADATLTIDNTTFSGGEAVSSGFNQSYGGQLAIGAEADVTITNSTFDGGVAGRGNLIAVEGSAVVRIEQSTVRNGQASGSSASCLYQRGNGDTTVTDTVVSGCRYGLYLNGGLARGERVDFSDSVFDVFTTFFGHSIGATETFQCDSTDCDTNP